jgi:hypothetical protein
MTYCLQCGTLDGVDGQRPVVVPKLVELCRLLEAKGLQYMNLREWHKLGIAESINLPAARGGRNHPLDAVVPGSRPPETLKTGGVWPFPKRPCGGGWRGRPHNRAGLASPRSGHPTMTSESSPSQLWGRGCPDTGRGR